MNQACLHNDTIDAGNHHGRPQYQPFLRFLTTQERSVIWLLLGIAFLPVDGTTLGLYAPFCRQSVRRCSLRTAYAIGVNCASQPTGTCQCSSCRWPA